MQNILVINSEYSFRESTISIDQAIDFARKNNINELALADIGNSYMHQEFIDKCKINNIKPILGITLINESEKITLLAKNNDGYKEIAIIAEKSDPKTSICEFDKTNLSSNIIVASSDDGFTIVNHSDNSDKAILNAINAQPTTDSLSTFKEFAPGNDIIHQFGAYDIDFTIKDSIPPWVDSKYDNDIRSYLLDIILPKFEENYKLDNNVDSVPEEFYHAISNELSVIKETGFQNYFITNAEILKTANESNINAVLRGSAVSSTVLYMVLMATNADKMGRSLSPNPVEHKLNFSRFLNPERSKRPDIDIDLSNQKLLVSKLKDKYFEYSDNTIAFIPSVSILHNKDKIAKIIKDVLLAEGLSSDKAIPLIMRAMQSDNIDDSIRTIKTDNYQNKDISRACDVFRVVYNSPQSHTCNAASLVISPTRLSDNTITTDFKGIPLLGTLKDSVDNNALKFDLLSNKYLEKMNKIASDVNDDEYQSISDENVISQVFNTNSIDGLYQISGNPYTKSLVNSFNISTFDDLTSAIALIRPAVSKDERSAFIKNKDSVVVNMYGDASTSIAKHLVSTRGILLYQDQIMAIAKDVAGFSDGAADELRVVLSKSNADDIATIKRQFIFGDENDIENKPGMIAMANLNAINAGEPSPSVDPLLKQANNVFNVLKNASGYSFNHSHALAYAKIITSQSKLKLLRPAEFASEFINTKLPSESDLSNLNIKTLDFNMHDFDITDRSYTVAENDLVTAYIKPGITSLGLDNALEISDGLKRASDFINNSEDKDVPFTKSMLLVSIAQNVTKPLNEKIPQHQYDLLVENLVSIKDDIASMDNSIFNTYDESIDDTLLSIIKYKLPLPTKTKTNINKKFNKKNDIFNTPINVVLKALEREGFIKSISVSDKTEIMGGNLFNKVKIITNTGDIIGPVKVMMETQNVPINEINDIFWHDWSTMSGGNGPTSFLSYLSSQCNNLPDLSEAKGSASFLNKLLNKSDLSIKSKKTKNFVQSVDLPPVVPKKNTFFNSVASDYLSDRGFSKKTIDHMLDNKIVYGAKYQSHKDKYSSTKVFFPSSNLNGKVAGQIINGRNVKTDTGYKFIANNDFKKQNLAGGMAGSFKIPSANPTECIICEGAEDAIALWELKDNLSTIHNEDIHAVFGTGHLNQFLDDMIGLTGKLVHGNWEILKNTTTTTISDLSDKDINDLKASLSSSKPSIETIYVMDEKLLKHLQPLSSVCNLEIAPDFESDKFYSDKNIFRLNSTNINKFLCNNNIDINDGKLVKSITKTTSAPATEKDFTDATARFKVLYGDNPTLTLAFDNDVAGEAFIPLIETLASNMGVKCNIIGNAPPFPKDHNDALIDYNQMSPDIDKLEYIKEYLGDDGVKPEITPNYSKSKAGKK
jgi:DNA polymerase III alpha subunit